VSISLGVEGSTLGMDVEPICDGKELYLDKMEILLMEACRDSDRSGLRSAGRGWRYHPCGNKKTIR
jgi:hypothetical protein